jgi:hypothetical protein
MLTNVRPQASAEYEAIAITTPFLLTKASIVFDEDVLDQQTPVNVAVTVIDEPFGMVRKHEEENWFQPEISPPNLPDLQED